MEQKNGTAQDHRERGTPPLMSPFLQTGIVPVGSVVFLLSPLARRGCGLGGFCRGVEPTGNRLVDYLLFSHTRGIGAPRRKTQTQLRPQDGRLRDEREK